MTFCARLVENWERNFTDNSVKLTIECGGKVVNQLMADFLKVYGSIFHFKASDAPMITILVLKYTKWCWNTRSVWIEDQSLQIVWNSGINNFLREWLEIHHRLCHSSIALLVTSDWFSSATWVCNCWLSFQRSLRSAIILCKVSGGTLSGITLFLSPFALDRVTIVVILKPRNDFPRPHGGRQYSGMEPSQRVSEREREPKEKSKWVKSELPAAWVGVLYL